MRWRRTDEDKKVVCESGLNTSCDESPHRLCFEGSDALWRASMLAARLRPGSSALLRRSGATRKLGGGPKTPGNFVQDGPPAGGYPTVDVRRSLPGGGLSSVALMATWCANFVTRPPRFYS